MPMLTARESLVLELIVARLRLDPALPPDMQYHLQALAPWLDPFVIKPLELVADLSAQTANDRLKQLEHARSLAKGRSP